MRCNPSNEKSWNHSDVSNFLGSLHPHESLGFKMNNIQLTQMRDSCICMLRTAKTVLA
jgi:hypothetical protein